MSSAPGTSDKENMVVHRKRTSSPPSGAVEEPQLKKPKAASPSEGGSSEVQNEMLRRIAEMNEKLAREKELQKEREESMMQVDAQTGQEKMRQDELSVNEDAEGALTSKKALDGSLSSRVMSVDTILKVRQAQDQLQKESQERRFVDRCPFHAVCSSLSRHMQFHFCA
mgnify:CR=1 FL=1